MIHCAGVVHILLALSYLSLGLMSKLSSRSIGCSIAFGALLFGTGCADLNSPYYPPSNNYPSGGYNDPYYGGGYNDRYDDRRDRYEDRRERERERERREDERRRIEEERRRVEEERDRYRNRPPVMPLPQVAPPPPPQERCPSGFQETNDKCSSAERKRGCRDIKMPSGRRCIDR